MRPSLNLSSNDGFVVSNAFPAGFQGIQLQGASVTTAVHQQIGTIVQQELPGRQFNLIFSVFNFLQPFNLAAVHTSSFVTSFLAIKNACRITCREMSPSNLLQGQFIILHSNAQEVVMVFDKAGVYHLLEVNWLENMVAEFIPSFTLLKPMQETKNLSRSFYITPFSKPAGFRTLGMAHALLRFPHKDASALYLFEHKIKEYLLSLLIAAEKVSGTEKHINMVDSNKIQILYEQLRDCPGKRFPISELARSANMSEKKLKKLFAQVFDISIFEFHLQSRMQASHRMLEEGALNTKEIASMVGYQLTTSFITRFREFFGYPPSEVKKT